MNKPAIMFSVLGSIITIAFFYIINSIYSFNHIWFIYPTFGVLWWPISVYYNSQKRYKEYSLVSSFLIIAFIIASNYVSTTYPWFLYAIFPVIWWPISMFIGRRYASSLTYAIFVSLCTILYYGLLNSLLSPGYPWFIYPAFAVLWWPLSLYYYRNKQYFNFSLAGSFLLLLFFSIVNLISTPSVPWAIYPIFAVLWWPLSMYYSRNSQYTRFSYTSSLVIILFLALVNHITTPHTNWAVYPSVAVLWWPMSMYFIKRKDSLGFSIASSILIILFFIFLNVITTPHEIWAVYPSFGVLWWPLVMSFRKARKTKI